MEHPLEKDDGPSRHRGWAAERAVLVALGAVGVAAVALAMRYPGLCRPITFDEADYVVAALRHSPWEQGWGLGIVNGLRHYHPPLLVYLLRATALVGGDSMSTLRIPTLAASIAAAAITVPAVVDLAAAHFETALVAGVLVGLAMATAPASVAMATMARPQPLVELLLVLDLWSIGRWFRTPSRPASALVGLMLGLQFVAMEYGIVVLVGVALAWVLAPGACDAGTRPPFRRVGLALLVMVATILALWPAGLLQAGAIENFLYYVRFANRGQAILFRGEVTRQVPWWAYCYWYWQDHPPVLVLMVIALAMALVGAVSGRSRVQIWLAVATVLPVVAVHRAHIMALPYSVFAVPGVLLSGAVAAATCWDRLVDLHWRRAWPLVVLGVLAAIGSGTRPSAPAPICAAESGLERVTRDLCADATPGETVLAQGWAIVRYVVLLRCGRDDLTIQPYDPSDASAVSRIGVDMTAGRFPWAILAGRPRRLFPRSEPVRTIEDSWRPVSMHEDAGLYRMPESALR